MKGKEKATRTMDRKSIFWNIDIKLVVKVHLTVTAFPHSPSHAARKQQVMAETMKYAGIRRGADGRAVRQLEGKQASEGRREEEREGGRKGWSIKKWKSEGAEEGEMENKRGHWRQIKDTQLND